VLNLDHPADVHVSKTALRAFCQAHHIRRFSLFGSVLTERFDAQSDIDVLVEFEEDHVPGFIGLAQMERELSELFGGYKVDLRTPEDLSRYFREQVLVNAKTQYEQP
jgi:predicted nucleotidyltransferase